MATLNVKQAFTFFKPRVDAFQTRENLITFVASLNKDYDKIYLADRK